MRRSLYIFVAVLFLVIAQVAWWTANFIRGVERVSELKRENLELALRLGQGVSRAETIQAITDEAFHQRLMFSSEAIFFFALTLLAFYLLFRTLRFEEKSRGLQRSFIEIVSHELKTPLTALKLRLESVRGKRSEDVWIGRELGQSLSEVRRMTSLLERALNLNRLERHAFQFETLFLSDVVALVMTRLDPFLREQRVNVNLDLDSEAAVRGDAQGLQNTVQSLVENAVLYNDKAEKKLSLRVVQSPHRILMEISDNGPGIAEEDRERVFQRFYRGRQNFRTPGSGLGLYIAKTIIEAHQGVIRLSASFKLGTKFEIEFPQVKAV